MNTQDKDALVDENDLLNIHNAAIANGLYTEKQIEYVNSVSDVFLRAHLLHQVRLRDSMESDRDSFEKQLNDKSKTTTPIKYLNEIPDEEDMPRWQPHPKPTPILVDEDELGKMFDKWDKEWLTSRTIHNTDGARNWGKDSFIAGYKAAPNIDKGFSLKDIEDAFQAGVTYGAYCFNPVPPTPLNKSEYLKSLMTT